MLLGLLLPLFAFAQQPTDQRPFETEIRAFERADSLHFPPLGGLLFIGSSSIRFWTDLQERFPDKPIVRRGFGGSELSDVIYYADRIIFPYAPDKIFIYAGENDIAGGKSETEVFNDFKILFDMIRQRLPGAWIYFISVKPSPSRIKYLQQFKRFNQKVRHFMAHKRKAKFINVFHAMLGADGQPRPEIFREDRLHMNKKGYDIWAAILQPYL